MYNCLFAAAAMLFAIASVGLAAVPDVQFDKSGGINVGGLKMEIGHFADGWRPSSQSAALKPADGFPKTTGQKFELQGTYDSAGGPYRLIETITQTDDSTLSYSAEMTTENEIVTNSLYMGITLSADRYAGASVDVDGETVALPAEMVKGAVFNKAGARKITLMTQKGVATIVGDFNMMIQDDRQFGAASFAIRLAFTPGNGKFTKSAFSMTLSHKYYEVATVSLASAANMGWRDNVDGDQKGGWTDQGSDNDLRMLKTGRQSMGPVVFDLVDPASNNGKSCIVLAGPNREYFPKQAKVSVPGNTKSASYLYLLHGSAWTPGNSEKIGTMAVTFADGSSQAVDVLAGRDVGNWWAPTQRANGAVVWTAENKSAYVGLYLSAFELKRGDVASVEFSSTGKGVWMIAGLSTANTKIPMPKQAPHYIIAGSDWIPFDHTQDIEKGSALDFSFLLDAPAGKYGHVVVKGPHFEYEQRPGQRVRFYGANLCFSANFPEKPQAEMLAERLARLGYNSIRIHHYDGDLVRKDAADSVTLDPEKVDRLDYLIHCLKQKGIYYNIDLYTFRTTKANEIPEIGKPVQDGYKGVVTILESAMKNWEAFARNVMTHKNQYTGYTWAEDPALMGICPLNEDPIGIHYRATPEISKLFDERFAQWVEENKVDTGSDSAKNAAWAKFLTETQIKANRRMFAFLKGLGVKASLSGVNCVGAADLTPIRSELEYVDNHAYWDHPGFPEKQWSLPFSYTNRSALPGGVSVPIGLAPSRVIGKPFTVTEINYCIPNRFRSEGGVAMGAYASLQDWDGLWRFAYSHSRDNYLKPSPAAGFDLSNEMMSLMSERIAILMFLRGDVAPAKGMVPFVVNRDAVYVRAGGWGGAVGFPADYQRLGLHTGIGSLMSDDPATAKQSRVVILKKDETLAPKTQIEAAGELPQQMISAGMADAQGFDPAGKKVTSDTGEIQWNNDRLNVFTSRSESFVMPSNGDYQGRHVKVNNQSGFSTVSVASLDGQPLETSRRVVVFHLTDLANSKMRFRDKTMMLLDSWGETPLLVRAGTAKISLPARGGTTEVWALDVSGKRGARIDAEVGVGGISFTANNRAPVAGCMAYEVIAR